MRSYAHLKDSFGRWSAPGQIGKDAPEAAEPVTALPKVAQEHTIFNPASTTPYALLTAEHPHVPPQEKGGNAQMEQEIKHLGLRYEPVPGHYNGPENSFLVYGAHPDQIKDLGRRYGQESVVYGKGNQHNFFYTNGEHTGQYHTQPEQANHRWWESPPAEGFWSNIPGVGHVRIDFDWNKFHNAEGTVEASKPMAVAKADIPTAPPQVGTKMSFSEKAVKREMSPVLKKKTKEKTTLSHNNDTPEGMGASVGDAMTGLTKAGSFDDSWAKKPGAATKAAKPAKLPGQSKVKPVAPPKEESPESQSFLNEAHSFLTQHGSPFAPGNVVSQKAPPATDTALGDFVTQARNKPFELPAPKVGPAPTGKVPQSLLQEPTGALPKNFVQGPGVVGRAASAIGEGVKSVFTVLGQAASALPRVPMGGARMGVGRTRLPRTRGFRMSELAKVDAPPAPVSPAPGGSAQTKPTIALPGVKRPKPSPGATSFSPANKAKPPIVAKPATSVAKQATPAIPGVNQPVATGSVPRPPAFATASAATKSNKVPLPGAPSETAIPLPGAKTKKPIA